MKKFISRKFIVFMTWAVLIICNLIFIFDLNRDLIDGFKIIYALYISGEAVIDGVTRYKHGGKNE